MNRKTNRFLLVSLLACPLFAAGVQIGRPGLAAEKHPVERIAQELLDAVAPGDEAVWERHLDDTCLITDEEGNRISKAELLPQLTGLPPGYSGSIEVTDAQVREYGDVAIITHRDVEQEEIFGQRITARYQATDVYQRRDGRWRMIGSHVTALPSERKAVAVAPRILDRYVDEYRLSPTVAYVVTREGGQLYGQRTGRAREELLATSETTFFRKGAIRGEKIFVPDDQGRIARMIDRRDNNDIVWTRSQVGEPVMSLIGKRLLLRYESGLQVEGHYVSPTEVRWKAVTGPAAGKTGTEEARVVEVAPDVFFVSWLEKSGTTISQVLDLNRFTVTAFVTFDGGGGRKALHDRGSISELASPPA